MRPRTKVSDAFRLALLMRRASGERVYQLAQAAQVRPNELSGLTGGSMPVRPNDPRVLRVAAILGVAVEDCFVVDSGVTP